MTIEARQVKGLMLIALVFAAVVALQFVMQPHVGDEESPVEGSLQLNAPIESLREATFRSSVQAHVESLEGGAVGARRIAAAEIARLTDQPRQRAHLQNLGGGLSERLEAALSQGMGDPDEQVRTLCTQALLRLNAADGTGAAAELPPPPAP